MSDEIIDVVAEWVPIKNDVASCIVCVNYNQCIIIGRHMAAMTLGEFRFRCPIIIEVEDTENIMVNVPEALSTDRGIGQKVKQVLNIIRNRK